MIPSYNDSEVNVFHPIVGKSLNKALALLGIANKYEVIHHDYVGNVEMDFVVRNTLTHKSVCVVEVKRTPAAVKSQRYQLQAKSYVDMMADSQIEQPYYILTNIECSYLFRDDKHIAQVYKQIIKPGLLRNIMFDNAKTEQELIDLSANHYKTMLETAIKDTGEYDSTIEEVVEQLACLQDYYAGWKSNFARIAYEYIRGALHDKRSDISIHDIRQYHQRIDLLRDAFKHIDFEGIFNCPQYADTPTIDNKILSATYKLGKTEIDADELASAVHHVISKGHSQEGEVPTDIELARLMLVVAKIHHPCIKGCICDPAAGSGNLISCVSEIYKDIRPCQIKANDINPLLLQILSLRLGLKFANSISSNNAPKVSSKNIIDLPADYFDDVEVVVMNPPMVSGVSNMERKQELFQSIENAKTNVGQMPLEGAFIEYVTNHVKDGTLIVTLIPKTHLTASGSFAIALRQYLLNDFGLSLVFDYPNRGIFKEVAKATVMLVGRKGTENKEIISLSSLETIPNINPMTINRLIGCNINGSSFDGIEYKKIPYEELNDTIVKGWRNLNTIMVEAADFIERYVSKSPYMHKMSCAKGVEIMRGRVGNQGLTDLLFLSTNKSFESIKTELRQKLAAGMHNAKYDSLDVGKGDSSFFDIKNFKEQEIEEIKNIALRENRHKGKQQRKTKSPEQVNNILKLESVGSCTEKDTILIPRNIRASGRIFRCTEKTFVSTNFFLVKGLTEEESIITASWMATIFYQICCEVHSKNQEGARKMEKNEIGETFIPCITKLSEADKKKIVEQSVFENFVVLKNPKERNVDRVWAKILFDEEWEKQLYIAKDLLARLANIRDVEL